MRPLIPVATPRARAGTALALFLLACHGAGALGALTTDPAFYRALERPAWAPPGWLFGPVWLTLYTAIGVAGWLVWRQPVSNARRTALAWFAVQLALNAAWSPVFFGLRALGAALAVIVVLEAAIVAAAITARRCSRLAAALLVPYAAWVAFAGCLNAALWWLARAP